MNEDEVEAAIAEAVEDGFVEVVEDVEVRDETRPSSVPPARVARAVPERLLAFKELGWWLANAEGTRTPQAGAAAALRYYYADALGFPPTAAGEISVIDGRIRLGSKLLRAIAEQQGYRVVASRDSDEVSCTAILYRAGAEVGRSTFTMAEATRAGLASRSNWRNYPARMLWARAAQRVLDDYAPAVVLGIDTGPDLDLEPPPTEFRDADLDHSGQGDDVADLERRDRKSVV